MPPGILAAPSLPSELALSRGTCGEFVDVWAFWFGVSSGVGVIVLLLFVLDSCGAEASWL